MTTGNQTLRILVQLANVRRSSLDLATQVTGTLTIVDGGGLAGRLVDTQRDAAVLQFRIGIFRGGRQKHHHRTFDAVRLGCLPPPVAALADGGHR